MLSEKYVVGRCLDIQMRRIGMSGLIAREILESANRRSPASIWQGLGYTVVRAGCRELRVMDEGRHTLFRSVQQDDGSWLSCLASAGMRIAPHVGDNISLVRHFYGTSFQEAVQRLENLPQAALENYRRDGQKTARRREYPYEPPTSQTAREAGLAYLERRGVSPEIAAITEDAGTLGFAPGTQVCAPALLFKGYDETGRIRYIAKRLISAPRTYDRGSKFDMSGSSKSFVPFFQGNPDEVFITEGGVNLLSILQLRSPRLPTVIMSGGSGNIHFIKSPLVQDILRGGKRIYIMGERDFLRDGSINPYSLKGWDKLKKLAEDFTGENVPIVYPPENAKDINDWLVTIKNRHEEASEGNCPTLKFSGKPRC